MILNFYGVYYKKKDGDTITYSNSLGQITGREKKGWGGVDERKRVVLA